MSTAHGIQQEGATAVAEMLHGYGVTHLFMVPAIMRRTFAELERLYPEISPVTTHGEKAAVYMADGYARAGRRPGVCAAQAIGALNLAAGLREPFLARSPVVALTGGRLPATKFRQVYQEADDLPAFEPGHQVQRRGRRRHPAARHAAVRVPVGDDRLTGTGSLAGSGERGAARQGSRSAR